MASGRAVYSRCVGFRARTCQRHTSSSACAACPAGTRRRHIPGRFASDLLRRFDFVTARTSAAAVRSRAGRVGWAYQATIQDLYDHFIVGNHFGQDHSVNLVTRTLRQAIQQVSVTDGLVLLSDQGQGKWLCAYQRVTQTLHITPSMLWRDNGWDNAPIENSFGHLKEEALRHTPNPSFELKKKQTPYQKRCLSP